jgi:heme oxygenase
LAREPEHDGSDRPLSIALRQNCADEHNSLESMIGGADQPMSVKTYISVLLMFRALHYASDEWREQFAAECHRHRLPQQKTGLVDLIDLDLETLDACMASPRIVPISGYQDREFSFILGGLYVVMGSALGNALMLRQIHLSPDTAQTSATRFLSATAKSGGPTFQAFRLCLDAFGMAAPLSRDAVIAGARSTFNACGMILAGRAA